MQRENEYIGDDNFKKFLEHYNCPLSINVVKMRILGAVCSPNLALRPTDVFSSLWPEGAEPRLETKKEAELFFKFFMGLWDFLFDKVMQNKLSLAAQNKKDPYLWAFSRYEEIEQGYLEGFWGGQSDLKIPTFVAKLLDSLSETAELYAKIARQIAQKKEGADIQNVLKNMDKTVEKALKFIVENAVLPRIKEMNKDFSAAKI